MEAKITYDGKEMNFMLNNITINDSDAIEISGFLLQKHIQCLSGVNTTSLKGRENMSLTQKLKNLTKTVETKLLEKYEIIDECGDLTEEGVEVLLQNLFEKHKAEIVEDLKKLDKEDK